LASEPALPTQALSERLELRVISAPAALQSLAQAEPATAGILKAGSPPARAGPSSAAPSPLKTSDSHSTRDNTRIFTRSTRRRRRAGGRMSPGNGKHWVRHPARVSRSRQHSLVEQRAGPAADRGLLRRKRRLCPLRLRGTSVPSGFHFLSSATWQQRLACSRKLTRVAKRAR